MFCPRAVESVAHRLYNALRPASSRALLWTIDHTDLRENQMGVIPMILMSVRWLIAVLCIVGVFAPAQAGEQKLDNHVTAYLSAGANDSSAVLTLWMSNVNPVIGVTLPLKFVPGDSVMHLDSALFTNGVVGPFLSLGPRYTPKNQSLLVNFRRHPDSTKANVGAIPVGHGLIGQLFFSSKKQFPMQAFMAAAIKLPPEARLMYVTDTYNSVLPEFVFKKESPPQWPPDAPKDSGKSAPQ